MFIILVLICCTPLNAAAGCYRTFYQVVGRGYYKAWWWCSYDTWKADDERGSLSHINYRCFYRRVTYAVIVHQYSVYDNRNHRLYNGADGYLNYAELGNGIEVNDIRNIPQELFSCEPCVPEYFKAEAVCESQSSKLVLFDYKKCEGVCVSDEHGPSGCEE